MAGRECVHQQAVGTVERVTEFRCLSPVALWAAPQAVIAISPTSPEVAGFTGAERSGCYEATLHR
jgi:hypothetical protein